MVAPQVVPDGRRIGLVVALALLCFVMIGTAAGQPQATAQAADEEPASAGPVFVDGQAQVVEAFADSSE